MGFQVKTGLCLLQAMECPSYLFLRGVNHSVKVHQGVLEKEMIQNLQEKAKQHLELTPLVLGLNQVQVATNHLAKHREVVVHLTTSLTVVSILHLLNTIPALRNIIHLDIVVPL